MILSGSAVQRKGSGSWFGVRDGRWELDLDHEAKGAAFGPAPGEHGKETLDGVEQ
jgi:hypothetical protein